MPWHPALCLFRPIPVLTRSGASTEASLCLLAPPPGMGQARSMAWILRNARRYPLLATTLLVAVLGIVLWAAGWPSAVQWLYSGFALVVAAMQAYEMVRDIMRGHWGLDILAVTAIVATVLVNEYVASLSTLRRGWCCRAPQTLGESVSDR